MRILAIIMLLSCSLTVISQEKKKAPEFVYKRSGYTNYTEMGPLVGEKTPFPGTSTVAFSFQTVNGYRFVPAAMLGAGIGVDFYPSQTLVPVFASLRGDFFTNWPIIPFYFLDAGYGMNLTKNANNREDFEGGLTYGGGIGGKIPFSRRAGFLFGLGYKYQATSFRNNGDEFSMEFRRLAIRAGFFF